MVSWSQAGGNGNVHTVVTLSYSCSPGDAPDLSASIELLCSLPAHQHFRSLPPAAVLPLSKHVKLVEHSFFFYCFDSVQYFKEDTAESRW